MYESCLVKRLDAGNTALRCEASMSTTHCDAYGSIADAFYSSRPSTWRPVRRTELASVPRAVTLGSHCDDIRSRWALKQSAQRHDRVALCYDALTPAYVGPKCCRRAECAARARSW